MQFSTDAIKTILWASIEDYVGIWELPWELSSIALYDSEKDRLNASKEIVTLLLRKGLVKIYLCKEPYGDMTEVSNISEGINFLDDENMWKVPNDDQIGVRISATENGENFYNRNEFDELLDI